MAVRSVLLALCCVGALALAVASASASSDAEEALVDLPANVVAPRRSWEFNALRIKSLATDNWNASVVASNSAGGVACDLVWAAWEPALVLAPCPNPATQVAFDGHCYTVQSDVDSLVRTYSGVYGLTVHARLYGSPAWAATNPNCKPADGDTTTCAPDNAADFARFAGFVASRYSAPGNASGSNGLVSSYALWPAANTNAQFNVGCGGAQPACTAASWVSNYAQLWTAAYDAITASNPTARISAAVDHSFGASLDALSAPSPVVSVQTFVSLLVPQVGSARTVRLAFAPYTPDRAVATFSPDDLPYATPGSLGAVGGWLLQEWPERTELWNELTVQAGVNSNGPESSTGAQANGICQTFWNVLGTPGIVNYVYEHLRDDATADAGLLFGLVDATGANKIGWSAWSQCNGARLSCGFGSLPNTKLQRSKSATRNHWTSTRLPPTEGKYGGERAWFLWRDAQYNASTGAVQTVPLFECLIGAVGAGGGNLISPDPNCEPALGASVALGLAGYAYTPANANAQKFLVPLYRCVTTANKDDHFVSGDSACEGQTTEMMLGYVLPAGY